MKKQFLLIGLMASVTGMHAADGADGAHHLSGVPDVIGTLRPGDMAAVRGFDNFLRGTNRDGIDDYHDLAVQCQGAEDGSAHYYMAKLYFEIKRRLDAESRFAQTEVAIQNRRLTLAGAVMVAWIVGREVVPRAYGWYVQRGVSR